MQYDVHPDRASSATVYRHLRTYHRSAPAHSKARPATQVRGFQCQRKRIVSTAFCPAEVRTSQPTLTFTSSRCKRQHTIRQAAQGTSWLTGTHPARQPTTNRAAPAPMQPETTAFTTQSLHDFIDSASAGRFAPHPQESQRFSR